MTYEEFINNILETRGRFACGNEYHERHHIVPKCMGGSNDKENLIDLFAREHFEAHRLLALENPENEKLVYAWGCMAFVKRKDTDRYKVTPDEYEEARIKYWIHHQDNLFPTESTIECSHCHEEETVFILNDNYCPNCGAKMDGGDDGETD